MAKPVPLTLDAMSTPQITPQAATPARGTATPVPVVAPLVEPKIEHVPLQIRIPKDEVRAIKIAAAQQDKTISEFMLACFHAHMKSTKHD